MKVEIGINPNCSELIVRINEDDIKQVRKTLHEHGIEEYIVNDLSSFDAKNDNSDKEWDESNEKQGLSYVKDAPKKLIKAIRDLEIDESDYEKNAEIIRSHGYSTLASIHLIDTELPPPDTIGGIVYLSNNYDNEGVAVVGHQHCQPEIYPLMKRISDIFDSEVQGFDGGSNAIYNAWVDAGCPDVKTWEPEDIDE